MDAAEKVIAGLKASKKGTRAVVAMSGGVDSSLTACLYRQAGYHVIGLTMRLSDAETSENTKKCCAGRDIKDARDCAARLGIDHYVIDMREAFKKNVIDDFVTSYARGETPIPCVRCNQYLKFEKLLEMAKDLDAQVLASGHYVRKIANGTRWKLCKGVDENKDQSYFLFATTQEQLSFCDFPLGHLNKEQTRHYARKWELPVAEKQESQDICFVPGKYSDLLERLAPETMRPGQIIDRQGRVLGHHRGIARFTIGQRRGLELGGNDRNTVPRYVIGLDAVKALVTVGTKEELRMRRLALDKVSWIAPPPRGEIDVMIKIRARMAEVSARIIPPKDGQAYWSAWIPEGVMGVAPGQACVFYQDAEVLGGGWIVSRHHHTKYEPPVTHDRMRVAHETKETL